MGPVSWQATSHQLQSNRDPIGDSLIKPFQSIGFSEGLHLWVSLFFLSFTINLTIKMALSNKEALDMIARILAVKNKPQATLDAIKELVEATGYDLSPLIEQV